MRHHVIQIILITVVAAVLLHDTPGLSQAEKFNSSDTTIVIELLDKWNLVSLPVIVADRRVITNIQTDYVYGFRTDSSGAGYYKTDILENGHGYRIKSAGPQAIQISGGLIFEDTIDVHMGWNLIGSVSRPVSRSSLRLIPNGILSPLYCFCADCYCEVVYPGHAYWIHSSVDGKLVISALSIDTTITIELNDGWNLVSLPVAVPDNRASANFPVQSAFGYQNTDSGLGYYTTDRVENGSGYWINMDGQQTIWIQGGLILEDTVDVHNGSNLIGSISRPVPLSRLRVIPSGSVDYFPISRPPYFPPDTILSPGSGHWIKISTDSPNARLIISAR